MLDDRSPLIAVPASGGNGYHVPAFCLIASERTSSY